MARTLFEVHALTDLTSQFLVSNNEVSHKSAMGSAMQSIMGSVMRSIMQSVTGLVIGLAMESVMRLGSHGWSEGHGVFFRSHTLTLCQF